VQTAGPFLLAAEPKRAMNPPRRRSAFTPLELVAVVVTTTIVAAAGYSAHRTYRVRAEVHEGLSVAAALAPEVDDFFRRHGEVPTELSALRPHVAASAQTGTVVETLTLVDGRIDVLFGSHADPSIVGRRVSLTPYESADMQIVWVCGNESPGAGLMPLGFAGGGRQASQVPSTVDDRYLGPECR
jgi:Tfp pilus assembly protein PilE